MLPFHAGTGILKAIMTMSLTYGGRFIIMSAFCPHRGYPGYAVSMADCVKVSIVDVIDPLFVYWFSATTIHLG